MLGDGCLQFVPSSASCKHLCSTCWMSKLCSAASGRTLDPTCAAHAHTQSRLVHCCACGAVHRLMVQSSSRLPQVPQESASTQ
jgi:hypothetical protein